MDNKNKPLRRGCSKRGLMHHLSASISTWRKEQKANTHTPRKATGKTEAPLLSVEKTSSKSSFFGRTLGIHIAWNLINATPIHYCIFNDILDKWNNTCYEQWSMQWQNLPIPPEPTDPLQMSTYCYFSHLIFQV